MKSHFLANLTAAPSSLTPASGGRESPVSVERTAFAPRPAERPALTQINVRLTVPSGAPFINLARAMTALAESVNGHWEFGIDDTGAHFDVHGQAMPMEVQP